MGGHALENVEPLIFQSNNDIEYQGPTLASDETALGTGVTSIAKLYDDLKDGRLEANSTNNIIKVGNVKIYDIGDKVWVTLDDRTVFDGGAILSKDIEARTLTLTNTLTSIASTGSRVVVKLGADVTMSLYGIAIAKKFDWGYRGVMAKDHSDIRIGLMVRIEIEFTAGVNKDITVLIRTTVVGGS